MQAMSPVLAALLALWNQGPDAMRAVPTGYPGPHGRTAVMGTAAAMLALLDEGMPHMSRALSEMKLYLMTMQNDDGGYGSTSETALVIKALTKAEVWGAPVQRALDYMANAQSPTGGWPRLANEETVSPMATAYIVAAAGDVRAFRKTVDWGAVLRQTKTTPKQDADGCLEDLPTTQYWIQAAAKAGGKGAAFDLRAARRWYDEQPNTPAAVRLLVAKDDPDALEGLIADKTVCKAKNKDALRGIGAAIAILENLGGPKDLPIIQKLQALSSS